MSNLDKEVLDKNFINDNIMNYSYLHDPETYRILPQHNRLFFVKPSYAKQSDFSYTVSPQVWAFRVIGSLLLLKLGYEIGVLDGDYVNKQLAQSTVVDMESEEQIYHELFNKNATAVFVYLYSPGHWLCEQFNRIFESESPKYEYVFNRFHRV